MKSDLLTNSRMACARTCLRKHFYRFELGIVPEYDKLALRVGTAYHKMHEAKAKGLNPWDILNGEAFDDPYDRELVARLFMGYEWRYEKEPIEIVKSELPFLDVVRNPETGSPTPLWRSAGKLDGIVRLADGRLALLEYKTTSDDISPGSDYWVRLRLDQQITGYFLAARNLLGFDVQTVLYDVVRKPALRPYKATPPEKRKVKKDGTYYADVREQDETPDEYGERLATAMAEDPTRYYMRIEIPRLERDLDEWSEELWQQQLMLRNCQRTGHWFRNTNACTFPYRCEYLDICGEGFDENTIPPGFKRLDDLHPELDGIAARAGQAAQPL
jgi:hypothetical protein